MAEPSSTGENSVAPTRAESGWGQFLTQLQRDAKLWLVVFIFLWLFRWLMIFLFRNEAIETIRLTELLKAAVAGGRFDCVVATYVALPCVLCSAGAGLWGCVRLAERVRAALGICFLILGTLICAVAIGFFQEYHDRFNQWIFGVIYDDLDAILKTVWDEYHVVWILLAVVVVVALGAFGLRRFLRDPFVPGEKIAGRLSTPWRRGGFGIAVVLLLVGGARGSAGSRPMLKRDAAVAGNALVNKMVMNPFIALRFALTEHWRVTGSKGLNQFLPDGDVARAARRLFPTASDPRTLDDCLKRTARGATGPAPDHIFIVVMESQDLWPILPQYRALGLGPCLAALADNGIWIEGFLSAGETTMKSLGAIISGLPDAGVFTNYQPSSRQPFPTSAAPIFKRLGYRTRFFYGGTLSWERMGEFCEAQGFDEVHGADRITKWGRTSASNWGVKDEFLFRYVVETVTQTPRSFDVIMTTSYHPPFDIDVYAAGFPLREIPPEFKAIYDGKTPLKVFGHYWYADQCIGEFARTIEQKLPRPLLAITGDHHSRRFLNARPSLYERTAVPCVLYGRDVLANVKPPTRMAGSHLDLAPTLVELSAPPGFEYHCMGGNLLDPARAPLGLARNTIIGPDFVLDVEQPKDIFPLPGLSIANQTLDGTALKDIYLAFHGLGWWRIMKGPEWPADKR